MTLKTFQEGLCFFTPSSPIFSKFRRNDSFEGAIPNMSYTPVTKFF